ncbi:MAG: ORF6N domain-containing protein [Bacteriovoracaceae bacterium]|nr:ORF6N domain-containing protein [Bacteriovoracaceae bacterium]
MNESKLMNEVENMIYSIRGQRVMLDMDLAELYGVETKALKKAVRRNIARFPEDFMFELSKEELSNWRSQFGTSNSTKMGLRYAPFAFTEQGVAMLSSVLRSDKAIQINISIMRIFTKLRSFLLLEKELRARVDQLDRDTNKMFKIVFERLDEQEDALSVRVNSPKRKIGLKK